MPENFIYELYYTGECNYKNYELLYLNQKLFQIRLGRNSYKFYDLANFLDGSLNSLAKKYLGKEKLDTIDSSRLNNDINYWNENIKDIIKYCIVDAKLTQELGNYFWKYIRDTLKFNPRSPYSKGAISQEYFLYKCPYIPRLDDFKFKNNDKCFDMLRHAYYSYAGGRFELLKRGYIENIYLYDIKSAYPAEIANLIDYTPGKYGRWIKTLDYMKCDQGFWYCEIDFFHTVLSPFMQKLYGLNIYPVGSFKQFLSKREIEFILQNFKEANINLISGYGYIQNPKLRPEIKEQIKPFKVMNDIYKLKESADTEEKRNAFKIIANSLYGKFWQQTGGHTGKLFNPIWASQITSNVRLKLLEIAMSDNNLKHIIGFSTDSIFIDKPIDNRFIGKEMGKWELKFKGKSGVFLMSDIYTIHLENEDKHKLRGFKIKLKPDDPPEKWITVDNIVHNLDENLKFKYKITRPMNLGECIVHNKEKNLSLVNIWKEEIKEIDINGDTKRLWEKKFESGEEVMEKSHSSKPIFLE